MSEDSASPRVKNLLTQLAELAIAEQDSLRAVEVRYQENHRRKERQHREAVAALEQQWEITRDNDYDECEIRKQIIFEDTQAKRERLLSQVKQVEETQLPSTRVATYPDHSEAANPEAEASDPRTAAPVETPQSELPVALVDGQIETETNYPRIPSQRGVAPKWIPKGTRVWILNPLKLKDAIPRTHLQGTVSRHGSLYHFVKIWNPVTNRHEEHRRHRENLAIIE